MRKGPFKNLHKDKNNMVYNYSNKYRDMAHKKFNRNLSCKNSFKIDTAVQQQFYF